LLGAGVGFIGVFCLVKSVRVCKCLFFLVTGVKFYSCPLLGERRQDPRVSVAQ
jgi:hypothetical protein